MLLEITNIVYESNYYFIGKNLQNALEFWKVRESTYGYLAEKFLVGARLIFKNEFLKNHQELVDDELLEFFFNKLKEEDREEYILRSVQNFVNSNKNFRYIFFEEKTEREKEFFKIFN